MISFNYEPLEYEEFVKRGKTQMRDLKEKYERTQDKTYLKQYNEVKNILYKGSLLKDYCIFGISPDDQLAYIECVSKDTARTLNYDIRKERLFNFV
ncbi:hypothetical protein J7J18_04700 [bacterium]|nr:hypothetical protein [bacterium]